MNYLQQKLEFRKLLEHWLQVELALGPAYNESRLHRLKRCKKSAPSKPVLLVMELSNIIVNDLNAAEMRSLQPGARCNRTLRKWNTV